jgi:predicted nuclease of predicted toxin-antitoxin system
VRFKVDENLPVEIAELLGSSGHEADTVADENASGVADTALAALCRREGRTLITLDRGFADIRAYPPGEYQGIVVLRPERQDKDAVLRLSSQLVEALRQHPLAGYLWVLEPHRLRLRGREE